MTTNTLTIRFYRDNISFADAFHFQRICDAADFSVKLFVGYVFTDANFISLPNNGSLLCAGGQVLVDAVVAYIQFAAPKPVDVAFSETTIAHCALIERMKPGQVLRRHSRPKPIRVVKRPFVLILITRKLAREFFLLILPRDCVENLYRNPRNL